MTTLTVYVNCSTSDLPLGSSAADWVEMVLGTDYLVFSNGSDSVYDGAPIPSEAQLAQAGMIPDTVTQDVEEIFLADVSDGILKKIHNAGNQNKQYVFAFDFDDETATEPVLELWDSVAMTSTDLISLGAGTPTSSWWSGIATTSGLPGTGTNWVGSTLAGSTSTHYLSLNNGSGPLSGADTLYCNLKITVPAGFTTSGAEKPTFAVKYYD